MNSMRNQANWDRQITAAVLRGESATVEKLVRNGIDPDTVPGEDMRGWTLLMLASRLGNVAVVQTLVRCGADPLLVNDSGQTAEDVAKFWGHKRVVQVLKQAATGGSFLDEDDLSIQDKTMSERERLLSVGLAPSKPNFFSPAMKTTFDRSADYRKDAAWLKNAVKEVNARFLVFRDGAPLVATSVESKNVAICWQTGLDLRSQKPAVDVMSLKHWVFLGIDEHRGNTFWAFEQEKPFDTAARNAIYAGVHDRRLFNLNQYDASIVAYARALLEWQKAHVYCPKCGSQSAVVEAGHKLECTDPACPTRKVLTNTHYPRTDPVVITLVVSKDGSRCLLGRNKGMPTGMYTCLSGFVEGGESLEAAVRREIKEETGVVVGPVRYHSNQPWPYPMQMMIGCIGFAETEAITIQEEEIEAARWFTKEEVRDMFGHRSNYWVPPKYAIAHHLIKSWSNMASDFEVQQKAKL
eukprot:Clim_evm26s156 gene=Clim_evmTU26s156